MKKPLMKLPPTHEPIPEPAAPPPPRVSIDAEAWKAIESLLMDLPWKIAHPVLSKVAQSGGVRQN